MTLSRSSATAPTVSPGGAAPTSAGAGILPAAVLWDMDGTIIDTEPQWLAAEVALAKKFGSTWTEEQGAQLIGMSLIDTAPILREQAGIELDDDAMIVALIETVADQVRRGEAAWRPGARELLADLRAHHVPCALVTMSYPTLADVVIDMLPAGTFDAVVTGDLVDNGKPHPESYVRAAAELGVDIADAVAIEDSIPGVTSAVASGAQVLAVPAHVDIPASDRYTIVHTLDGVRAADLLALAARQ